MECWIMKEWIELRIITYWIDDKKDNERRNKINNKQASAENYIEILFNKKVYKFALIMYKFGESQELSIIQ